MTGVPSGSSRGGAARHPRRRTGGGLALSLDISRSEWDRRGRPGTRRGPAPVQGPSARGPAPHPARAWPPRGSPPVPVDAIAAITPTWRSCSIRSSHGPRARQKSDRTGIGFHAGDRATPGSHLRLAGHARQREPAWVKRPACGPCGVSVWDAGAAQGHPFPCPTMRDLSAERAACRPHERFASRCRRVANPSAIRRDRLRCSTLRIGPSTWARAEGPRPSRRVAGMGQGRCARRGGGGHREG